MSVSEPVRAGVALLVRLPSLLLIALVRLYQLTLSPYLGSACRFTPTCSAYGIEALRRYGAVRGSVLTAWRILRCNPFNRGGYDPPRWFGEPPPGPHEPHPGHP